MNPVFVITVGDIIGLVGLVICLAVFGFVYVNDLRRKKKK
jgi:hypothetical protein